MTTFTTQDRQDAQRTPLTEQDILMIMSGLLWEIDDFDMNQVMRFTRAIEAAHGIGE